VPEHSSKDSAEFSQPEELGLHSRRWLHGRKAWALRHCYRKYILDEDLTIVERDEVQPEHFTLEDLGFGRGRVRTSDFGLLDRGDQRKAGILR
jgi:hypothetical protein